MRFHSLRHPHSFAHLHKSRGASAISRPRSVTAVENLSQADTSSSTSSDNVAHRSLALPIVAIVISTLVAIALVAWFSYLYWRKQKRSRRRYEGGMDAEMTHHAPSVAGRGSMDNRSMWGGSTLAHSDITHISKYETAPSLPMLFPPKPVGPAPSLPTTNASTPLRTPATSRNPSPAPDRKQNQAGYTHPYAAPAIHSQHPSQAVSLSLSHTGDSVRDSTLTVSTIPSFSSDRTTTTQAVTPGSKSPLKVVLCTFNPLLPDELVVAVGERVTILSTFKDGWCVILVSRQTYSGQVEVGAVPAWCFEEPLENGKPRPRPVRGDSLGVSVSTNGEFKSHDRDSDYSAFHGRKDILSWSNF